MDRFCAKLFYKHESIPIWKTILFLFFAILFSIGSIFLFIRLPKNFFGNFSEIILFVSFVFSFIYWFFRGWSSSKVCKYEFDPKYKGYSLAVARKGLPISVIDLKNILAIQKHGELCDETKRKISRFYNLLERINQKSIDLYFSAQQCEINSNNFLLFLYKSSVCFIGPALLILFIQDRMFASWFHVILTIICFFAAEFFWYRFGLARNGEIIIPDPKFEDLSNQINAEEVIQNYIYMYETYLESYDSLDFSEICEIFSFQKNDINYLCARLIEIDLLTENEEMRSVYKLIDHITNFLAISRTYVYSLLFILFDYFIK